VHSSLRQWSNKGKKGIFGRRNIMEPRGAGTRGGKRGAEPGMKRSGQEPDQPRIGAKTFRSQQRQKLGIFNRRRKNRRNREGRKRLVMRKLNKPAGLMSYTQLKRAPSWPTVRHGRGQAFIRNGDFCQEAFRRFPQLSLPDGTRAGSLHKSRIGPFR